MTRTCNAEVVNLAHEVAIAARLCSVSKNKEIKIALNS